MGWWPHENYETGRTQQEVANFTFIKFLLINYNIVQPCKQISITILLHYWSSLSPTDFVFCFVLGPLPTPPHPHPLKTKVRKKERKNPPIWIKNCYLQLLFWGTRTPKCELYKVVLWVIFSCNFLWRKLYLIFM